MHRSVDEFLAAARERLPERPGPAELERAMASGALVVDIRPVAQRSKDGQIPGAIVIERNVLEWRLDPASEHRLDDGGYERQIVIVCDEGYASTLAAAALQDLGLRRASDLHGGFQAWRSSGRPVDYPDAVSTTAKSSSP